MCNHCLIKCYLYCLFPSGDWNNFTTQNMSQLKMSTAAIFLKGHHGMANARWPKRPFSCLKLYFHKRNKDIFLRPRNHLKISFFCLSWRDFSSKSLTEGACFFFLTDSFHKKKDRRLIIIFIYKLYLYLLG